MRDPQHHGQLVSDWVDTFAPVLWKHYAPDVWPEYVLLDDSEYTYRPVKRPGGVKQSSNRAFIVLAAVGYVRGEPKVVAIGADRAKTLHVWKAFLGHVPGQPRVVVGDRGAPLRAALGLWGGGKAPTLVRRCEWHLGKNLRDAVPSGTDPGDPIWRLIGAAFADQSRWDALAVEASARLTRDRTWVAFDRVVGNMDQVVRAQVPYGAKMPGPVSTGPVENFLRELRPLIGDRAHGFTNKQRTTALLYLVALARNGWGTPNDWAKVIREHLQESKGRAPKQRRHVDPLNKPSLRPRSKQQRWTKPPPRPKGSTAKPTR